MISMRGARQNTTAKRNIKARLTFAKNSLMTPPKSFKIMFSGLLSKKCNYFGRKEMGAVISGIKLTQHPTI